MATNGKEEEVKPIEFYEDEDHLQKLCDFLRSKEGPPVREAVEMEKRVYYLKGKFLYQILRYFHVDFWLSYSTLATFSNTGEKLVNFLVEPKKGTKWPSKLPRFQSRSQAIAVCKDLCKYGFVHRSEKRGKGQLAVRHFSGVALDDDVPNTHI
jgi:translocation protein SEC62